MLRPGHLLPRSSSLTRREGLEGGLKEKGERHGGGIFSSLSLSHTHTPGLCSQVDALAPLRGGEGGGGSDMSSGLGGGGGGGEGLSGRLVSVLLTLMDGMSPPGEAGGGDRLVVVAATNRPAALDPALRRPGRFERELEVGVPGPAARLGILRSRLRGVRHSLGDSDVVSLSAAAHGFVGADLAQLVDEAALSALRRRVAAMQVSRGREVPSLSRPLLLL